MRSTTSRCGTCSSLLSQQSSGLFILAACSLRQGWRAQARGTTRFVNQIHRSSLPSALPFLASETRLKTSCHPERPERGAGGRRACFDHPQRGAHTYLHLRKRSNPTACRPTRGASAMQLKPIRTEADHEAALREIERLLGRQGRHSRRRSRGDSHHPGRGL